MLPPCREINAMQVKRERGREDVYDIVVVVEIVNKQDMSARKIRLGDDNKVAKVRKNRKGETETDAVNALKKQPKQLPVCVCVCVYVCMYVCKTNCECVKNLRGEKTKKKGRRQRDTKTQG